MKPYRMLAHKHIHQIEQKIMLSLRKWNQEYAISEIHFRLEKYQIPPDSDSLLSVHEYILADKKYLSSINVCLFGEDYPACNSTGIAISELLFNSITGKTSAASPSFQPKDWFYPGSTCLKMILEGVKPTHFYLHPDWVYQQLEKKVSKRIRLVSPENALQSMKIPLSVRFKPLNLPVHMVANLSIGNLIPLEHSIDDLLELCHDHAVLAFAKPGQQNQTRNITIQ